MTSWTAPLSGAGAISSGTNKDEFAHTVTGVANSWGDYEGLGHGDTVSYQFDRSAVFPYFCLLHPSMGWSGGRRRRPLGKRGRGRRGQAVSAQVSGGQADEPEAYAVVDTDDRDRAVPVAIGVGVLAAMTGFAGAFVLRRKSSLSE
ncbi:MAG TPA: hypothetical protein VJL07_04015 [Dehalococcoidia bacterium]|nr:hypothetical protein [Dehalococcoidia bacterium]